MTTTGYRIVYLLLAVAFFAIVAGALLFIPSGDPETLPAAVESYSPQDGDIVVQPIKVILDLAPNYDARFVIDGIPIPPEDVDSILATGRHQFDPGPGKAIERWTPGDHTVVASYIGGSNNTDVGTVVWTFRVQ
ncbi:MAG: hypothetical protein ACR2N2_10990 [Acidimicrobiia bacterium]